jgi:hypothetical protein
VHTKPLEYEFADPGAFERTDEPSCEAGIALSTVAQVADPELVPAGMSRGACRWQPDDAHPSTSFLSRVLARQREPRDLVDVPGHVVLRRESTGVKQTRRKP